MEKSEIIENEFITFKNSQGTVARGTILKVTQNHIVFETYNPYSVVQLSEILDSVKICRFNENLYVGKAVVSNLINTGLLLIVSATLVDPWLEKVKPSNISSIHLEMDNFISDWSKINAEVLPDYQISVNKIRSFLNDLNRWLRQFESEEIQNLEINQNKLIDRLSKPVIKKLSNLILNFESEAKKIDQSKISICKKYTQQELHPYVMQSPFGHRVFTKPLGYAGDYEMVNMMLSEPYQGETIYAKMLNLFLLDTGPAEAHRNRIEILLKRIKSAAQRCQENGRRTKIFNFACGPAVEIQKFISEEELANNCDFVLLDFSKETLEYTYNELNKIKIDKGRENVKIELVHKSVNDVLRSAVGSRSSGLEKDFDLIYCAGLFDYLSDKVCAKLLKLFYDHLKEGGDLLATNVHSNNPVRSMMEHIFEWHLIYRNEQEFSDLMDVTTDVYCDKTGLNIFLETQKK